jgi:hypothetical protein
MIEISAALAAFKAAKDLGKVIFEAKIDHDVQEKYRGVLDKLGDAQDTLYELRDELLTKQSEVEKLQRTLSENDDWRTRIGQFAIVQTAGGAVVHQFEGGPPYYACPNCINDRRIVPLQDNRTLSGKYRCVACKSEYPVEAQQRQAPIRYPQGPG